MVLLALLATFAPDFDAPLPGNEFGQYISAPAEPRGDTANLARATLGFTDEADEESDDEPGFLSLAALDCASVDEFWAADVWLLPFRRPQTQFCTGPPSL